MMSSKESTEGVVAGTKMMGGGMERYSEDAGADPTNPSSSKSSPGPAMVGGMRGMMSSDGSMDGVGAETDMMGGYGVMGGGMGMGGYGGMSGGPAIHSGLELAGFPGAPFVTTVVTVHVKKSTIDEFAQGKIDFRQFREAVQVFKY